MPIKYFSSHVDPFGYGIPQTHPLINGALVIDIESTVPVPTEVNPYLVGCDPYMIGFSQFSRNGAEGKWVYGAPPEMETCKLLIGHNIKYDLALLRKARFHLWDRIPQGMMVWDTQFAHYLMTGQRDKWPSLDEVAQYWALPTKPFNIGEQLALAGWDISKVPNLSEYLRHDVETTLLIAAKQWDTPHVKENLKWYLAMMDGYMGTFEMEYNGYWVDMEKLAAKHSGGSEMLEQCKIDYKAACQIALEHDCDVSNEDAGVIINTLNLGGPKFVKPFIFGGELSFYKKDLVPTKTGKMRTKKQLCTVTLPAQYPVKPSYTNVSGNIKLDVNVLTDLVERGAPSYVQEAIQVLLKMRLLQKSVRTYVENVERCSIHAAPTRGVVHPNVNTCATATGRTSSSNPNMQNNPAHDILNFTEVFCSRWNDGVYLEVDFKQLEVIWLAYLSRDGKLMWDLQHGVDIHGEIAKLVFGKTKKVSKEDRKRVKRVVFGMIYGGGAATLAEQSGLPESVVIQVIQTFERRYPQTTEYFRQYREAVAKRGKTYTTDEILKTPIGNMPRIASLMESPTGRRYHYTYDWDAWKKTQAPPYTATRNYPIQGIATGDFMLNVIGIVWRTICQRSPNWKLVGLIHDSLLFDCASRVDADDLRRHLLPLLENAGNALVAKCPNMVDFDLPIEVEFTCGENLGSLEPME